MQDDVLTNLDIALIDNNPDQPRKRFNQKKLEELANSIRENGVLQPIRVEPTSDGRYVIQHGERRWRATKMAGLTMIPAIIGAPQEEKEFIIHALVENLGREDLNVIEEATVYKRLLEAGWNLHQISKTTGRAHESLRGRLAWLELEDEIQTLALEGQLPVTSKLPLGLLTLPPEVRVELARRMADLSLNLVGCLKAIEKTAAKLEAKQADPDRPRRTYYRDVSPMMEHSGIDEEDPEVVEGAYAAAAAMCKACSWKPRNVIPSWELVKRASKDICDDCQKKNGPALPEVCRHCPGVSMLQALVGKPITVGDEGDD